jgi:hypothetical protein
MFAGKGSKHYEKNKSDGYGLVRHVVLRGGGAGRPATER